MKTLLKRLWLGFLIRCDEIHLADLRTAYQNVRDVRTLVNVMLAIDETEAKLAKLRSEYNATLPIGQRKTWKVA